MGFGTRAVFALEVFRGDPDFLLKQRDIEIYCVMGVVDIEKIVYNRIIIHFDFLSNSK